MITVGARSDSKGVFDYVVYGVNGLKGQCFYTPNFTTALKQAGKWAEEADTYVKIYPDAVDQLRNLV